MLPNSRKAKQKLLDVYFEPVPKHVVEAREAYSKRIQSICWSWQGPKDMPKLVTVHYGEWNENMYAIGVNYETDDENAKPRILMSMHYWGPKSHAFEIAWHDGKMYRTAWFCEPKDVDLGEMARVLTDVIQQHM